MNIRYGLHGLTLLVVLGNLGWAMLLTPVAAAPLPVTTAACDIGLVYVGNTEVDLSILYQGAVTIYRNDIPIFTATSGNNTAAFKTDTGLVKGQRYTYRGVVDADGQRWTCNSTPFDVVAGEVSGLLTRDVTWAGDRWAISPTLTLAEGVRLTIAPGTTVQGPPGATFPGSGGLHLSHNARLTANGATLSDLAVYGLGTTSVLAIQDSTLHNAAIAGGQMTTFARNTGRSDGSVYIQTDVPAGQTLEFADNVLPGYQVAITLNSSTAGVHLTGNTLTGVEIAPTSSTPQLDGDYLIANNVFTETLNSWGLTVANLRQGTLTIANNLNVPFLELRDFFTGTLGTRRVSGNTLQRQLTLRNVDHLMVEDNIIAVTYPDNYGIQMENASYNQIVRNRLRYTQNGASYPVVGIGIGFGGSYGAIYSTHNEVFSNTLQNFYHTQPGEGVGIGLGFASDTLIRDNIFIDNRRNIQLGAYDPYNQGTNDGEHPANNRVYNNIFARRTGTGVANFWISAPCTTEACVNTWAVAKTPGSNIIGGAYLGGNCWSDYVGADPDGDGLGNTAYELNADNSDPRPLFSADCARPDLVVTPFILQTSAVTYRSGRYYLPVDVRVQNVGSGQAAASLLRVSDNGGWSQNFSVGTLLPGAAQTFHVEWELTAILAAGRGVNTVQLNTQADSGAAVVELSETNNDRSATLALDVRPRVLGVRPEFPLDNGHYYLQNEAVANPIKVFVDWNGLLPGTGNAPYGAVYFNVNGVQVKETGQSWGAQHTYDMGGDFQPALGCPGPNVLRLWAALSLGGVEITSLETALQPIVFPFPGWVQWVIQNIPGSDASFETTLKSPVVEYVYDFKYPEPPFEADWTPPGWVPFLGGQPIGIRETQAEAAALGRSNGSGQVGLSGQTGMEFGALTARGLLSGQGDVKFKCGESLDLTHARLNLDVSAEYKKEMGLAELVPGLRAAESWPVIGRIIRWVNGIAKISGAFGPGVNVQTVFEEQTGELKFVEGTGQARLATRVTLATEVCEDLSAEVYGGGTPYVTVQAPAAPSYLKDVGIDLDYGATFTAWHFEAAYERAINCAYPPGACVEKATGDESGTGITSTLALSAWHLIPRDYAGAAYARPVLHPAALLRATTTAATTLVTNIYPRPEPALALTGTERLLVYVQDDLAKPHGRGTELYALRYNGGWLAPTPLTNDAQPDFAPTLAYAGNRGLLLWERSTLPTGITPTLSITFAQSLEIAGSVWNGSAWSAPVTLTTNSLMDHAPRLAIGGGGAALALWQTNDGTDILGTPAHPLTLTYALWNGTAWNAPAPALAGLYDVLDVDVALNSAALGTLVYVRDMDGLLSTTTDSELFYSTFNGVTWSVPTQVTSDTVADTTPAVAYDPAGVRHLLWLRGGQLVELRGSWDPTQAQVVLPAATEGGLLGFRLSRAADGNLALSWQAVNGTDSDLTYSLYDGADGRWSAARPLLNDLAVEAAHSPAFGDDGNFYLAYQQTALTLVTKTVTMSPTLTITVTGLPQPGQSDLVFLEHPVGYDWALESLQAAPANPAPGQAVTLTAVLRNAGDRVPPAPQVAFYDGATAIATRTLALSPAGGYTVPVTLSWTLPFTPGMHTLIAVADPAALITETDEANNAFTLTTSLPDLWPELAEPEFSSTALTVTVRVGNAGAIAATMPFTLALRLDDPLAGTQVAVWPWTASVERGGLVTATRVVTDLTPLAGATGNLWLRIDAGDVVWEADESNNEIDVPFSWRPDLTLTAVDIADDGRVTVHNRGYLTATGVLVEVHGGSLTGAVQSSQTIAALAPGASAIVPLTFTGGLFFVRADPLDAIPELDESNNLATGIFLIWQEIYLPLVLRHR